MPKPPVPHRRVNGRVSPQDPSPRAARDEAILDLVASIPRGKVMTYGDVARALGLASPRLVGHVLSRGGHEVPWQRVVLASGACAPHVATRQLELLQEEGAPTDDGRVELRTARWTPPPAR